MKEFLIKNGWIQYASGCPCQGLPRYYMNPEYLDWKIVLKNGSAAIRRYGIDKFKTKNIDELKNKMIEYEIITKN